MKNIHWVDCVLNQEIYGDMKFSDLPDKIHCRPGKVITVFVSFKVGKPPINIVFFIYRVFNNGTYPIVFSINSYVSVYSAAPRCTHVHSAALSSLQRFREHTQAAKWDFARNNVDGFTRDALVSLDLCIFVAYDKHFKLTTFKIHRIDCLNH